MKAKYVFLFTLMASLIAAGVVCVVVTLQILLAPNMITTTTYEITSISTSWGNSFAVGFLGFLCFVGAVIILAGAWLDLK